MHLHELHAAIKQFHLKHGSAADVPLCSHDSAYAAAQPIIEQLELIARTSLDLFKGTNAPVFLRAHLITEELAEMLNAIVQGDPLGFLDGWGDLQYVVTGTGVCYGVKDPDGILQEIQRSNMTKAASGDPRVSDKGVTFEPPDLRPFL